ncbi:flagellar basal body P-ring formation chaperone FlgA [Methylomonas rapida]|uniref:Flagella basal body P-ring formation protein FlgA n=1 Tax=Methylomonas rapida TaxID=2963939 RepID=A0ABY7GHW5_9GAMM|nr:flagellar basal body P-ring formation chaperone FlgA [Methylomonas rapida]WAR44026.1 flagellar basal body P-ring formation chaperone FlgA [Methylomonas rapida]
MKTTNFLCLLLMTSQLSWAASTQSLQLVQDGVNSFVQSSLEPSGQYQISSAQIDDRLQLPECDQDLEFFAQSSEIKPGRNTVGIRCNGTNSWTIYSTVLVKSFKDVLVLAKQLNRGERITPAHLKTERRDIATLQQGYIVNPDDVLDKQATRFTPTGSVLNRMHYSEPTLVKRGERVNIQSGKAGLLISTMGVAMMDGIKGQQISVKNATSQRVIQATVLNPGVVTVNF